MDPSDPKSNPQNPPTDPLSPTPGDVPAPPNAWSPMEQPQSGGPQPNLTPDGAGPILPGQFVITGEDTPAPAQNTQTQFSDPGNIPPPAPVPEINTSQNANLINQSPNNLNAQDQLITPPSNQPVSNPDPIPVPQSPASTNSQPDPTPFMPPTNGSSPGSFSKPPGGGIKKLRTVIIVLGIIILLMIAGAIAWFFFFSDSAGQAAKTEDQTQSAPAIEQQPVPKRGEGGFNQIQENSTPSGQLQESTPAVTAAPTL